MISMRQYESMQVVRSGFDLIDLYRQIPIGFQIESRLRLPELISADIVADHVEPYWKDYDELESPASLPSRFDVSNWELFIAYDGEQAVGGAIIAWKTAGLDMLKGRSDLSVLWDIRVHPDWRGKGVGREIFRSAVEWAKEKGCTELHVETQDINVPACRFYQAMGCTVESVDPQGYGPDLDEAKVIWRLSLPR